MLLASSRPVRVLAFAGNFQNIWLRRVADLFGVILISPRPKSIVAALKTARQALLNGELVCVFPEGAITRSGQMQAFRPGLMKILEGTGAPVVPVYLDELWGSIFSFHGGKFFWKRPQRWPYPISIFFGRPVANPADVHRVRQAVQELGATAVEQRTSRTCGLARSFVRTCKKRKRGSKIADSLGNELSGGVLLTRSLILRRLLQRHVLADDEQFVGLLVPPSVAGVIANTACALARRVPVNLNYTVTSEVINECIRQAGIRHVITSRQFMEKVKLEVEAELVYLEDFRNKARFWDKLACSLAAYGVPAPWLERSLGVHQVAGDDLATVIFTSGSTGVPKGVMLTQTNIGSNVQAIEQIIQLRRSDVLVGVLPFFHSFGYTVCLWAVMCLDVKGVYHFNPLEAKQVGKLTKKHGGTVFLATPTFLRTYLRRCDKDELETLDAIVAGAEKLPRELCEAFEAKFGVRPVEGYGTTELSPLVSANIPPRRSPSGTADDWKEGTVGRPAPGVSQGDRSGHRSRIGRRPAGHALDQRSQRHERLPRPRRFDRRGDQGRLVHDRRHRPHRRRRVHSDHRPAKPVLQDRRRNGAALADRGSPGPHHRRRRRGWLPGRGDRRDRREEGRANRRAAHRHQQDAGGALQGTQPTRLAEPVYPLRGQFPSDRRNPGPGNREAGSPPDQTNGGFRVRGTLRVTVRRRSPDLAGTADRRSPRRIRETCGRVRAAVGRPQHNRRAPQSRKAIEGETMTRKIRPIAYCWLTILCTTSALSAAEPAVDLAGPWRFRLDPDDVGIPQRWFTTDLPDRIQLPGSLQAQGYGNEVTVDTKWTGDIIDRSWFEDPQYAKYREPGNVKVTFWLQPEKHYVGAAWYQRTIDVPAEFAGRRVVLHLERPHWTTRVWVDDRQVGMGDSLSTPHEFELRDLEPGPHRLTVRVDNRLHVDVGPNSHSVSDHTQTNWNGIIGAVRLRRAARGPHRGRAGLSGCEA